MPFRMGKKGAASARTCARDLGVGWRAGSGSHSANFASVSAAYSDSISSAEA